MTEIQAPLRWGFFIGFGRERPRKLLATDVEWLGNGRV